MPIQTILSLCPKHTIVVHGAARGADTIAGVVAEELGLLVKPYPADWDTYGKTAGPIRNSQMLNMEHPDFIFSFHNNIEVSKGTKHMVDIALRANKTVIHYGNKSWFVCRQKSVEPIYESDLKKVLGV